MAFTAEELDRHIGNLCELDKAALSVLGHLEGLIKKGLVARGPDAYHLKERGMEVYRELEARGYHPPDEALRAFTAAMLSGPPEEDGESAQG